MNEYMKLSTEAVQSFHQGDTRASADKYLAAFRAAPSKWSENRYHILHGFTSILGEKYFPPSPGDFEALEQIASDKHEPFIYRSEASFKLGLLRWDARDRDEAADMYRRAIRHAKRADAKERRRQVMTNDDAQRPVLKTAGEIIDDNLKTIESNLSILENPCGANGRTDFVQRIRRSDGSSMENEVRSVSGIPMREVDPKRLGVGGDRCDGCDKTLKELGMKTLKKCSKCQMAYYCGAECQGNCWRAGHKEACRKPGQIEQGDFMKMQGLESQPSMNGLLVRAIRPVEGRDRWTVEIPVERRTLSIATKNLEHIRPEK